MNLDGFYINVIRVTAIALAFKVYVDIYNGIAVDWFYVFFSAFLLLNWFITQKHVEKHHAMPPFMKFDDLPAEVQSALHNTAEYEQQKEAAKTDKPKGKSGADTSANKGN